MIFEIKLPDLGEGVVEGEIVKILVSKGEAVSLDQPLMEVMTDKASMEIPGSKEGVVHEVKAKPGDRIAVGQTVMTLRLASRDDSSRLDGPRDDSDPAENGAGGKNALSREPAKKTSLPEKPAKKETAAETRPATDRIAAEGAAEARPATETSPDKKKRPLAAPFVRKLAEDLNIPLQAVSKKSDGEKILKSDLVRHIKERLEAGRKAASGGKSPPPVSAAREAIPIPKEAGDRREVLVGIKRAMRESMTRSLAVPHFTVLERAEVSRLIKLREELKPRLLQQNLKITYLPFIIKAAALCLKKFPVLNSCYDEESGEIVYKKSLNINFAADTSRGLTAPVIHEAGDKSVLELAQAVQSLAAAARSHKLTREQLTGGTFTVTNLGSVGGIAGTPVITPPQAAVLGVYRIEKQAKLREGKWEEIPFMNLSLTCDHRLIDGATAARFLKDLRLKTEDPGLLLWGD